MQLFLDSRQARRFKGHHPWVLDTSIVEPASPIEPGSIVELVTTGGGWVGRGIYNPKSRIRVRLYQWQRDASLTDDWFRSQLDRAFDSRQRWISMHGPLDAIRWVNSEGDGLSGLIVEQYGDYVVVQWTALSMVRWESALTAWLAERLNPQGVLLRVDNGTAKAEGLEPRDDLIDGRLPESAIEIREGSVRLQVDLLRAQKSGYYLDQRTNRVRAAKWMSGGPMLDVCCYLGGFSLAAHHYARPSTITAIDSSASVLEQAKSNAQLNAAEIEFVKADCFECLSELASAGKRFATVVLDPPRLASHRGQVASALRAYHRLNLGAVNLLEPGGILVSCSCTGRVSRSDLVGVLAAVSHRTRRNIQILESTGADFDHPVSAQCPEGEYLKCLICRVE